MIVRLTHYFVKLGAYKIMKRMIIYSFPTLKTCSNIKAEETMSPLGRVYWRFRVLDKKA